MRVAIVTAALACASVLAACGSGSPGTTAASSAASTKYQAAIRFAQCVRTHGVPSFPDPPASGGGIAVGTGHISKDAPNFQAATRACRSLLPNQGRPTPLSPARQQAMLAFARCMRAHGLTSFPDPQFGTGGDLSIRVNGGKLGADPAASPVFRSAQAACAPALRAALGSSVGFSTQGPG